MLSPAEKNQLISVYQSMYPTLTLASEIIPHSVTVFKSCYLGSTKLGCSSSFRTRKVSYILASNLLNSDIVPGQIQSIFSHCFILEGVKYSNIFCEVSWYGQNNQRYQFGNALQVFSTTFHNTTFLPHCHEFFRNLLQHLEVCMIPMNKFCLYVHCHENLFYNCHSFLVVVCTVSFYLPIKFNNQCIIVK